MRTIIVLTFCLLLSTAGFAADGDGGYAGAWFDVPLGARPTAMGGAYTAISNDGAASLYNPAGLANIDRVLMSTSYRAMKLDRRLGYAMVVSPIRNEAVLGFNWIYSASGEVEARDGDGIILADQAMAMHNHKFSAIFAKRFESYFAAGVNLNYVYSRLPKMSAAGVGFDIGGMLYLSQLIDREKRDQMPIQDIQVGLTIKHINEKYKWNSDNYLMAYTTETSGFQQEDKVPVEIALGTSARFVNRKLLVDLDASKNEKQGLIFRAGGEFFVSPQFALRAGYGDDRLAAGTGYIFNFARHTLAIDYAFSTDKADEGSEHIISLDFLF